MVKITLFGLAGCGTSTVAKLFSEKYDFTFMSGGNLFRDMAKKHNLDLYEFSKLCQTDKKYDIALDKKQREFGESNEYFIFESRMGWHFIPDSIKVKLICDEDIRINRICERENLANFEEIKEKTINREKSEKKRYFDYYNIKNYENDDNFDLIIDSTKLTPEQISEKIYDFINEN